MNVVILDVDDSDSELDSDHEHKDNSVPCERRRACAEKDHSRKERRPRKDRKPRTGVSLFNLCGAVAVECPQANK